MTVTRLVLLSLFAAACATGGGDDPLDTDESDDETADTDDESDTDTPAPVELKSWDFEDIELASGTFQSFISTPGAQPNDLFFSGDGADAGLFRPLPSHLTVADPLAAPADGSNVVYLNVQPWGPAVDQPGTLEVEITLVDGVEEGASYEIEYAIAQRLDLTYPTLVSELHVSDGFDLEVIDAFTPDVPTAGGWTSVTQGVTTFTAGEVLTLRLRLENNALSQQQVLLDGLRLRRL